MGVLGLWSIVESAVGDADESRGGGGDVPAAAAGGAASSPLVALTLASHHSSTSPDGSSVPRSPSWTHRLLAVDLSVWLMESHSIARTFDGGSAAAFVGPQKHHLNYIFNRACAFMRQSIRLVFVTDGRAPQIKSRLAVKGQQQAAAASLPVGHRRRQNPLLAAQIRDCARLLQLMDIPLLVLECGEAEALCGLLNARGSCDGVLTPDGDCFLFGGRVILRNLEASQSTLAAKVFRMDSIERHLGLDRSKLVLLALMLGSDYTSGVRGLGPRKAIKFLRVIDQCCTKFDRDSHAKESEREEHREDAIVRLFRMLISASTPDAGIQLIYHYHAEDIGPRLSPGAVAAAVAASITPPQLVSLPSASSVSPSSPLIDYSLMSLADLKSSMARHGLKAQSRDAMVSKLQQIQSLSSPAAAAAAASSSPAADSSPTIDLTHSPHVAPPVTIFLSDSDSDSDLPPATAAAARRGRPKRAKKSKTQLSLQAFLTTYFTKIHARYHDGSSREEMENILASYLRPALEPTVEVLEKQIPNRIPNSPDFLSLRSFCATEMKLPFVRFEKQWLPVMMHMQLWRQQQEGSDIARETNTSAAASSRAIVRSSSAVSPRPPASSPMMHSPLVRSASSVSSSSPHALGASSPLSAPSSPLSPLYIPSHISKRRIIQGVPIFVLVWSKTDRGRREIASLPRDVTSSGPQGGRDEAKQEDQDGEDEIDMTMSPAASPLISPSMSPSLAPFASSSLPPAAAAATAPKKAMPIQDVDINFYETYEPIAFLKLALPHLVDQFESCERALALQKEQDRSEKAAATRARKKTKDTDEVGAPTKPKATRGRKKKDVLDSTPLITAFLSPAPTAAAGRRSPEPTSSDHPIDLVTPSPPPTSSMVVESTTFSPLPAPSLVPPLPPASASLLPGRLPFRSSKAGTDASNANTKKAIFSEAIIPSIFSKREQSVCVRSKTMIDQSAITTYVHASKIEDSFTIEHESISPMSSVTAPAPPSPSKSSSASLFSSTLLLCPLCSRAFTSAVIDAHVNSCLDQQQLAADESLARNMEDGRRDKRREEAKPLDRGDDFDDAIHRGDRLGESGRMVHVRDSHPISHRRHVSATHFSDLDLPPPHPRQKRKSSLEHAARPSPAGIAAAAAAAAPRAHHRGAVSNATTSSRTAIRLDEPDDDEYDDVCDLVDTEEDDEQPGSTIYTKSARHAIAPSMPPHRVKSIFARD